MNWIYEHNVNNTARFTLGEYQHISDKTLICFGINPSTATPNNLDNTLKKVRALASFNGYTNWVMLNLYPQRATNPNKLHMVCNTQLCSENIVAINKVLSSFVNADILLAYGNLIKKRAYLENCLIEIKNEIKKSDFTGHILCIDITKQGNPIHPLYQKSTSHFILYDK